MSAKFTRLSNPISTIAHKNECRTKNRRLQNIFKNALSRNKSAIIIRFFPREEFQNKIAAMVERV